MADIISPDDAIAEFIETARDAGLVIEGNPIADGEIHRVPVIGSRSSHTSGSYVLHMDDQPRGYIKNWQSGDEIRWSSSNPTRALTAEERQAQREQLAAEQAAAFRDRVARELEISEWATEQWKNTPRTDTHPYLAKKGINHQVGDVGLAQDGRLVVPMQDINGTLWNFQRVSNDGEKRYLKGARKQGTYHLLGEFDSSRPLLLAEGFATGVTVHQATGHTVAVCFDGANLLPVAKAFRERYPDLQIVVAADNDHHLPQRQTATGRFLTNVGIEKAQEVAKQTVAQVVAPSFRADESGTDWNDVASEHGLETVKDAFAREMIRHAELKTAEDARASQVAALERVNSIGGDPEEKQKHLSLAFEAMKKRKAGNASKCWELAAETVVTYYTDPESHKLRPKTDVLLDQESERPTEGPESPTVPEQLWEYWQQSEERSIPPEPREKMSRDQVIASLEADHSLRDKDLSGLDLSGLRFRHVDLSGSDLSNTRNRGTIYQNCFMLATDFSNATFEDAVIRKNTAAASIWNGARLSNTAFDENGLDHAQMKHLLVVAREVSKEQSVQSPAQPQVRFEVGLVDAIKEDSSRLLGAIKRSVKAVTSYFDGTAAIEQQRQAMQNSALRACGWDGVNGSHSLKAAYDEAHNSFSRLAKSGQFTRPEIEHGIKIYEAIIHEQNQKRQKGEFSLTYRPQVVGNDFRYADLTGARMIGVDVKSNDFQNAVIRDFVINGVDVNAARNGIATDNQYSDLATHLERDGRESVRNEPEQPIKRPSQHISQERSNRSRAR